MESINSVTVEYLDRVIELYRSASAKMKEMGIDQWDEIYPNSSTITNDIESGTMFGYFIDDTLCAVQVLNDTQSEEYSQVEWKFKDTHPLVLHRLCVAPDYQNRGIAKKMVLFAEEYAHVNGFRTIRFDSFVDNPVSTGIYRKMGFIESGIVKFRKGDFHCFEKKTMHYQG
jgi:ribosomal protein S18 acetylase RimI-like enzyme